MIYQVICCNLCIEIYQMICCNLLCILKRWYVADDAVYPFCLPLLYYYY